MITMSAAQQALLSATSKTVTWLFDIKDTNGISHYWSTKELPSGAPTSFINWDSAINWDTGISWTTDGGSPSYSFKISGFSGINLSRPRVEAGIIGPSTVTFSVIDKEHLYSAATFAGGEVLIALRLHTEADGSDALEVGRWRFKINKAEPGYGLIRLSCENFYQQFLEGDYPNTDLIRDIFPSNDTDIEDNVCIPIPFGTAYIPLRSVYIVNARYYALGSSSYSYTISKVRSPRQWGLKSEWDSASYTFTQSTKTDSGLNSWRVFQPIIADSDLDGTADSAGLWRNGEHFIDMPTKFSRSDLSSYTNPADIIRWILIDFGVPVASINAPSFAAARASYASWGLTWNGALWYKEPRETLLARLLNMCHSTLRFANTVHLDVLSKTSRKTITKADILKGSDSGEGSFRYTSNTVKLSDSGYAAWQEADEAQDKFHKTKIPAKSTTDYISGDLLELPFVQNSIHVQNLASLYYQRKLLKVAKAKFDAKTTSLALRPDDVLTISDNDYGGTYDVLVDSVNINKDASITFECTKFSNDLDDWSDLSFAAITVSVDDSENVWEPSLSGPLSTNTFGRTAYDAWGKSWIVVSPVSNAGEFTSIQSAINALPADGGSIFLKNGTYSPSALITVPDKDIEIIGESQSGVIIKNYPGLGVFYLHNLTHQFKLSTTTFLSQNTTVYSKMILASGTTVPKTIGNIELDGITFDLADEGIHNGNGDVGIRVEHGGSSVILFDNISVSGGKRGITIEDVSPEVKVKNCILSQQTEAGLKIKDCPSYETRNNRIEDFIYYGIYISGIFGEAIQWDAGIIWDTDFQWFTGVNTADHGVIFGNRIMSADDAITGEATGIFCEGNNLSIAENTISIKNSRAAAEANGIYLSNGMRKKVSSNEIIIEINTTELGRGILVENETDGIIQGNSIRVDQKDYTDFHIGIDLSGTSARNVVSNNSIDEVYNNAKGIGINLGLNTAYNVGSGNITYNVGTSIVDAGSDNNVTATDV